ncbi:MAG: 5,6-dimethylbenzimidazole synthase [Alphaproteobacteria bacterium]|jgi:5,6-dimethylbenzimidazole synthase|nr:5,6-dimethylbenzimidazole synthase [Alphaproteobacteria bacterium]
MKYRLPSRDGDDCLSESDRLGLYRTIFARRDVRGQFTTDPIPDEVLSRVLTAAHFAPSVGYMQPWNFVVVTSPEVKRRVHALFRSANAEAAEMFEGARRRTYRGLKLEGILEAPVNLCVTCDRDRAGPVVLGRTHDRATDLYSTVCAVQNLWLAARAERLGVGWVSILDQAGLRKALGIPEQIVPVAYLCLGYVTHFLDRPELELARWRARLPLQELVFFDSWQGAPSPNSEGLLSCIEGDVKQAAAGRFEL